jgi:hypothetical protein
LRTQIQSLKTKEMTNMKEAKRNGISSFTGIVIFLIVLLAAGCSLPLNQSAVSTSPESRSVGGPAIDPSAPKLAAYWKFDQNLLDATANHNNGTITGPSSWAEGVEDKGITLSGTNNYVTCPDSTSLNIRGNITIEAWINTSSAQDEEICAKYRTTNPWAGYALKIVGGRLSFWFGGTSWPLSTGTVNDGKWHHVAVTGSGNLGTFYIDGQSSGTFAYSYVTDNSGSPFYAGCYLGAGCFAGRIDELAVWNRALTATEIKNQFDYYQQGLVAFFRFERNALDATSNHNDGTVTGPASWTGGMDGNCIVLSGTNNYVTCPDSASLNIQGKITIEAWIRTSATQDEEICAKYGSAPCPGYALKIVNGRLSFWFGGTSWTLSTGTVNDGNWHYVAVTGNGNAGTFYIDGSASGTFAFKAIAGNAGSPLYLGSYQGGGCFSGNIDELAIWNRALTAAEIQTHFNSFSYPHNSIYTAGNYHDGVKSIPCYWNGTVRFDLSRLEGLATSIFVSGSTVYAAGCVDTDNGNATPCYWTGLTKTDLPGNGGSARAIFIK